jgi:hypothetical protein
MILLQSFLFVPNRGTDANGLRVCAGLIGGESCPREVGQPRTHGRERIWGCEGLIDGEACPREVGQRTLSRTHGRKRIWVGEGLIDGEACPREGGSQWRSVL